MGKTIGIILSLKDKYSLAVINIAQKFSLTKGKAKKLNNHLRQIESILGAAAAVGATVGSVSALNDNIGKIKQNGGSVDSLQMGHKPLIPQTDETIQKPKNTNILTRLGIQIKDNSNAPGSQEDIFNFSLHALQKIENPTQKAILAQKLFRKAALKMKLLLNQVVQGINEPRQKTNNLGLVMSNRAINSSAKLTGKIDRQKCSFGITGLTLGAQFVPVVQQMTNFTTVFCNPARLTVIAADALISLIGVASAKGLGFLHVIKEIFNVNLGRAIAQTDRIFGLTNKSKSKETIPCHALRTSSFDTLELVNKYNPKFNPAHSRGVPLTNTAQKAVSSSNNITVNLNVEGDVIGNREFLNKMMILLGAELRKAILT